MASQRLQRFKVETDMLTNNPPPGITVEIGDKTDVILAEMTGPPGSPYEKGIFEVEVSLSERYPFTPPNARFLTQIYHPNVDASGRICLSGLKPKPSGTWNCSMNIAIILSAIRLLLSEPNLGDPLMTDIAAEYRDNYAAFKANAEAKTLQYAVKGSHLPVVNPTDEAPQHKVTNNCKTSQQPGAQKQKPETTSNKSSFSRSKITSKLSSVNAGNKLIVKEEEKTAPTLNSRRLLPGDLTSESEDESDGESIFVSRNPKKRTKLFK